MSETSPEEEEDSAIISTPNPSAPHIAGKLGWTLFNSVTLCLDLGQSMIAICDSINTFKQKLCSGPRWERFSKIRMLDDNKMIELETLTSNEPLRCMLDTGCTSNLLNTKNPTDKPLDQMINNVNNFMHFQSFQMGDKDFGPITFCPIPVKFPFHVDAILGVKFLLKHVVIIDFPNREIYIAPSVVQN